MKRLILIGLCTLISLTACTALTGSPAPVAPAPDPVEAHPQQWAARYPVIYEEWSSSVHGSAYLAGDTDAPGCTDCHPDPEASDIISSTLRLEVPSRCARCHSDEALMSQHEVATDVYRTYLADYHGATIESYRATDPTAIRPEAVCSDCHASHAIFAADDARSTVAAANLLGTCQQCHDGAGPKFVASSTGHFRTTADASILVFLVKVFYIVLIPVVMGGMLLFIGLDIRHRIVTKTKESRS